MKDQIELTLCDNTKHFIEREIECLHWSLLQNNMMNKKKK
jgi:hypothetical protein